MSSKNRSARRRAGSKIKRVTPKSATPVERAKAVAELIAAGRQEALSPNHYAEATELLKPLSTSSAVTAAPTRVVNEVARPKITLIEFADAVQLNINSQRFKTYPIVDGYAVRALLMAIAEQTSAIDVANINLDHLDS